MLVERTHIGTFAGQNDLFGLRKSAPHAEAKTHIGRFLLFDEWSYRIMWPRWGSSIHYIIEGRANVSLLVLTERCAFVCAVTSLSSIDLYFTILVQMAISDQMSVHLVFAQALCVSKYVNWGHPLTLTSITPHRDTSERDIIGRDCTGWVPLMMYMSMHLYVSLIVVISEVIRSIDIGHATQAIRCHFTSVVCACVFVTMCVCKNYDFDQGYVYLVWCEWYVMELLIRVLRPHVVWWFVWMCSYGTTVAYVRDDFPCTLYRFFSFQLTYLCKVTY